MDTQEKIRENRFRRVLRRRGCRLMKSHRRDENALGFGGYMIADFITSAIIDGATPYAFSLSLDDVESFIDEEGMGFPDERHL